MQHWFLDINMKFLYINIKNIKTLNIALVLFSSSRPHYIAHTDMCFDMSDASLCTHTAIAVIFAGFYFQ